MSAANMKKANPMKRLLCPMASAAVLLLSAAAQAAAPGITGNSAGTTTRFNLVASPANINQPDGQAVYSWGYGCSVITPQPGFLPATISTTPAGTNVTCPTMQVPGPTLIVTEGTTVVVRLTNNLPA